MSKQVGMTGALTYQAAGDLVASAKPKTMLAEFIRNGIEAENAPGQKSKMVWWEPVEVNGVMKCSIYNDGIGMTYAQMESLEHLACAGSKGRIIQRNKGMGARLSGLSASPHGVRYISCFEGAVHQMTFSLVTDVSGAKVIEVTDITDVTDEWESENHWVRVIFLGENADQDSWKHPWFGSRSHPISREFLARFFRIPADVTVYCKDDELKTAIQWLENSQRRYDVVTVDDINIHYSRSEENETRGGIVFMDEVYEYAEFGPWRGIANRVGLTEIGHLVSCYVELPGNYSIQNDMSRSRIEYMRSANVVRFEDFGALIQESMPEWVSELIESERQRRRSDDDDKLENEFREMITEWTPFVMAAQAEKQGKNKKGRCKDVTGLAGVIHGGDGHITPKPSKPSKRRHCTDEGDENSEDRKSFMPVPRVHIIYEGHEDYDRVQQKSIHVDYYPTNIHQPAIIYVNGNHPFMNKSRKQLIKIMAHDGGKENLMDNARHEVELLAKRHLITAVIGVIASAKMSNSPAYELNEALSSCSMSAHLAHLIHAIH